MMVANGDRSDNRRRPATSTPPGDSERLDVPDIVQALQAGLGQGLLAVIVNRDVRTMARWASATVAPPASVERTLRDTFQIFQMITAVDSPAVAQAWFAGLNPGLNDRSPAETIANGDLREVMAAARHFVAGN